MKSPKKIGRFTIRQVSKNTKSPKSSKKIKSPKKIGRFTIRQVPKKIKSPKKIGRFTIRQVESLDQPQSSPLKSYRNLESIRNTSNVYKKMMLEKKRKEEIIKEILSPHYEYDEEIDIVSPPPTLLTRQLSDPEYSFKKIVMHGFNFDILDESDENIESKVVYICDKLKENLLKVLEINKIIQDERGEEVEMLLNEKYAIKNKIYKYNNQMNSIIEMFNNFM
jgi:hypothetical protein